MRTNNVKELKDDVKRIKRLWGSERSLECFDHVEFKSNSGMLTLNWTDGDYLSVSDYTVDGGSGFGVCCVRVDELSKVMDLIDDDVIGITRDNEALYLGGFAVPLQPLNDLDYVLPGNRQLIKDYNNIDLVNHKKVYKCSKGIRSHIYGINFSDYGIASTDSRRLFVEKIDDTPMKYNITVPGDLCNILPKTFVLYECINNDVYSGAVVIGRQTICFKSIGEFPEYKNIIPDNFQTMIEVDHKTIKNMINKIKKLKLNSFDTIITINEQTVEIKSWNGEDDEGIKFKDFISDVYIEGEPDVICFNSDYVIDLLNQFDPKKTGSDKVKIEFNGEHRPTKIETDDRVSVLMPVRG